MRRRARRQNSNIFDMLSKNQIVELREAFNLMDINSDTFITRSDLETFLGSIGDPFTKEEIDEMMEEAGENMTFMVFLTLIGEKLSYTDDEKTILKAFKQFDEGDERLIDETFLRKWLMEEGDKMSEQDVNLLLKDVVDNGKVDYMKLTCIIKHGEVISK
jgi:myosin regulatory light chain 12